MGLSVEYYQISFNWIHFVIGSSDHQIPYICRGLTFNGYVKNAQKGISYIIQNRCVISYSRPACILNLPKREVTTRMVDMATLIFLKGVLLPRLSEHVGAKMSIYLTALNKLLWLSMQCQIKHHQRVHCFIKLIPPEQNSHHFADDKSWCIWVNEKFSFMPWL